jgi:protein MAK11
MAKRKREANATTTLKGATEKGDDTTASKIAKTNGHIDVKTVDPVIQIITGSYERVLHGITATISDVSQATPSVKFADSFLFNAHASAIRCLALSPLPEPELDETQGVYLATGGSDEKINVYSLSASPVVEDGKFPAMPSVGNKAISENPKNRELGSLLHHSSNITALHFPTRSKLLSGSEDNTIAVTRLRDLTVVSTVKAPHPKVQGQPSGDTAPPGATPAGVNDFAVHPSMKLMVSVGRGERCMRLWNLVTGKKAGVLNFSREVLQSVKEGKYSSGEGRRIKWSPDGTEFAVSFERGAVVFGEDSKPKCKILPQPLTKLHQISYLSIPNDSKDESTTVLAASTEDGRILFYNTDTFAATAASSSANGKITGPEVPPATTIPDAALLAQLGGKTAGITGRIKDFETLVVASHTQPSTSVNGKSFIIVTASSDGTLRLFSLTSQDLGRKVKGGQGPPQIGTLVGSYETGNRVTCLKAFVMLPAQQAGGDDVGDEFEGFDGSSGEEDESESDSGSD